MSDRKEEAKPESGEVGATDIWIEREQFTRYDREELHPECDNAEYLEYEKIGVNDIICSFGYKLKIGKKDGQYKYFWLPIQSLFLSRESEAVREYKDKLLLKISNCAWKLNTSGDMENRKIKQIINGK